MRNLALCTLIFVATAAAQEESTSSEPPPGGKTKKSKVDKEEMQWKDPERHKEAEKYLYCEWDNCYDLLGVAHDAGPIPIKRAYRRLAAEYHPDKCSSGDIAHCKDVFPKYANAYEVLSSTEMRKNYQYVIDNPYEFPMFYMKYSRPQYAPKSDLRFVIIVTLLVASAMQYLLKKSQHEQAFSALKRAPTTNYQGRVKEVMATLSKSKPKETSNPPSPTKEGKDAKAAKKPSKQEQQEALRKEAEAAVDLELVELLGEPPSPFELLAVDVFKLPLTTVGTVKWYLAGGSREPGYRTRKALGLSAAEWADCAEAEQTELVERELWISENLEAYEAEIAKGATKGKSGKEKRAARQAKKNPGTIMMDE